MSGLKEMPVYGGVSEHLQREEGDTRAEKKKEGSDSLLNFCQNTRHLHKVFFVLFSGYENLSVRQVTVVNFVISLDIKM
ncbi:hypothetical protein DUV57_24260 [Salmonella enterica subsp. enterica serovar Newport]|nr:hypothetical protein [Salmonella enterica subsp. enterica serovar Newport]